MQITLGFQKCSVHPLHKAQTISQIDVFTSFKIVKIHSIRVDFTSPPLISVAAQWSMKLLFSDFANLFMQLKVKAFFTSSLVIVLIRVLCVVWMIPLGFYHLGALFLDRWSSAEGFLSCSVRLSEKVIADRNHAEVHSSLDVWLPSIVFKRMVRDSI